MKSDKEMTETETFEHGSIFIPKITLIQRGKERRRRRRNLPTTYCWYMHAKDRAAQLMHSYWDQLKRDMRAPGTDRGALNIVLHNLTQFLPVFFKSMYIHRLDLKWKLHQIAWLSTGTHTTEECQHMLTDINHHALLKSSSNLKLPWNRKVLRQPYLSGTINLGVISPTQD